MVRTALDAAAAVAEDGRTLEVIDLRSLSPLDMDPVYDSVRRTGRLVVVHEAPSHVGIGAEVAARVTERCFYSLEAPVLRVTGYDTPYPAARVEEEVLPHLDRVRDAVPPAGARGAGGIGGGAQGGGAPAVLVGYGPKNTGPKRGPRRSADSSGAAAAVEPEAPAAEPEATATRERPLAKPPVRKL